MINSIFFIFEKTIDSTFHATKKCKDFGQSLPTETKDFLLDGYESIRDYLEE